MSQPFSVQDAIRQSSTDVDIDELTRRGLRKVKVLDKQTVFRLIDEAVNRVVEERLAHATAQERAQIQQQARAEFQRLVQDRQQEVQAEIQNEVEQQVHEYQARIQELEQQVTSGAIPGAAALDKEMLGAMIREAVTDVSAGGGGGGDIGALQKSIEALAKKVGSASGGSNAVETLDQAALETLFSRDVSSGVEESNINNVEVKNAKANGVNKNLAKLRSLQKGNE